MNPTNANQPAAQGQYASVNGLQLYYEMHGAGAPLVLLHGGAGAIEMFSAVLPRLAAGRQVIAVDLQAHGRTADIDRPMSYEAMADDIGALIAHLGLAQADVMGYSLGGGVALQTAIRHPRRCASWCWCPRHTSGRAGIRKCWRPCPTAWAPAQRRR